MLWVFVRRVSGVRKIVGNFFINVEVVILFLIFV